jgi:uncharacterized protein with PIN domain
MEEKISWVQRFLNEWMHDCPKCHSTDIKKLDIFKGHYKKGNPLKKRNQQKYECMRCGDFFWVEI